MPSSVSGDTSSTGNAEPSATNEVGVPVRYRVCSVPRIPSSSNTIVSAIIARLALAARIRPGLVKISETAAVAKTEGREHGRSLA